MHRKTVFIHFTDRPLNEEYGEDAGRARLFELIQSGYHVRRSVYAPDDNCLFITMERDTL